MASAKLTCSVVVPVYSGANYLQPLVQEIADLRSEWETRGAPITLSEAIFVLDDPIDDSARVIAGLAARFPWIQVIQLSRNFGQHPATQAGILHSCSDWVVTLDEDLQHRPKLIPQLLTRAAESSSDIVYARPLQEVHRSLYRDLASRTYKRLIRFITGNPHIRDFNSFRLIRGTVARATSSVCSHETYFDIALSWFTRRVAVEPLPLVDERYAREGRSGYSLIKLISHARRMMLSVQVKALRAALVAGLFGLVFSIGYGLFILIRQLAFGYVPPIPGWSSLMVATLFYGGIITLMIGILIEFLSIVILHTQGKPVFFAVDRSGDALLLPYFARRPPDAHPGTS